MTSQALQYVDVESVPHMFESLKQAFQSGKNRTLEQRLKHLRAIAKMLQDHEERFNDALKQDLNKPRAEAILSETRKTTSECFEMINHLPELMNPEIKGIFEKRLTNVAERASLVPCPLGVTLVIGAWNLPVRLVLFPAMAAIAAGNCVMMKPSEVCVHTAALFAELVPQYIPSDILCVANGAAKETTVMLQQPFNHFFYTGGCAVGKIVMEAASKHLAKVTLELGGKNPVVIDDGVDIDLVAKRVIWGRVANAGQICLAPDYVLCFSREQQAQFAAACARHVKNMLGEDPQKSPDYCRIANDHHFRRLVGLMQHGRIVAGGKTDAATRFIEPTVLVDVDPDSPLMQQEIFGPLLPVLVVANLDEALQFIQTRDSPLAAYLFSENEASMRTFEERVLAGGITINDVMMHASETSLPFGGVGMSGHGKYHGKYTFEEFSHMKPVLRKSMGREFLNKPRYPPYNIEKIECVSRWLLTTKEATPSKFNLKHVVISVVVAVLTYSLFFR